MFVGKCNHITVCQDIVPFNRCKNVIGWQLLLTLNAYCVFEVDRDNYLLLFHWSFTKSRYKQMYSVCGLKPRPSWPTCRFHTVRNMMECMVTSCSWRRGRRRRNCCGIHPTDEPGTKICWVPVSDRISTFLTTEIVFVIRCPSHISHFWKKQTTSLFVLTTLSSASSGGPLFLNNSKQ